MSDPIRNAVAGVLANASNHPDKVQRHLLGRDVSPLIEKVTAAVNAALPGLARPGHRQLLVKQALALADEYRAFDDTDDLVKVLVMAAAALAEQPEPEWRFEYGVRGDIDSPCTSRESAERTIERLAKGPRGYQLTRTLVRRQVSPWLPVTKTEKETS